jgi:hypothetical protein
MGSKNQSNYEDVSIAHFRQIHLDNFRVWCDAYVCKSVSMGGPPSSLLPPLPLWWQLVGYVLPHTTTKVTAQLQIPERIKS